MVINSISGPKIRNIFETTKRLRHYVCKKRESGVEIALISTPIGGHSVPFLMERRETLFYNGTQRHEGTKNYFRTQRRRESFYY